MKKFVIPAAAIMIVATLVVTGTIYTADKVQASQPAASAALIQISDVQQVLARGDTQIVTGANSKPNPSGNNDQNQAMANVSVMLNASSANIANVETTNRPPAWPLPTPLLKGTLLGGGVEVEMMALSTQCQAHIIGVTGKWGFCSVSKIPYYATTSVVAGFLS